MQVRVSALKDLNSTKCLEIFQSKLMLYSFTMHAEGLKSTKPQNQTQNIRVDPEF